MPLHRSLSRRHPGRSLRFGPVALAARSIAGAALIGLAIVDAAAAAQNLDVVRERAESFVRAETADLPGTVLVEVSPPDPRLRLPACERLEAFLPRGVRLWGRAQVGVRCLGGDKWSVTLPVHVGVRASALFAARPLSRGVPLSDADLSLRESDLTALPAGVLTDPQAALGRVPRTSLAAGLPITGDVLKSATVIQYGQSVNVIFEENGIRVSSEGRALGQAGIGDALRVRSASGKVVSGIVTGPGEVRVR